MYFKKTGMLKMQCLLAAIFFCAFLSAESFLESAFDENDFYFRGVDLGLTEPLPVDISFCIADLKFDGQNLKICEFGEGCHSKFRGFNKLYGTGRAWELFWIYMSQFNLPIWYVGASHDQKFKDEISYDTFTQCGGRFIGSIEALLKNKNFLNLVGYGDIKNRSSISNYKAIICVKHFNVETKEFRDKFPNVLIWDLGTAGYVNSKHKTTLLFEDDELSKYRPRAWLVKREAGSTYSRTYAQSAADQILEDKKVDYYVIKPVNGTMGQGILFVQGKNLQKTLAFVLKMGKKNKNKEKDLSYWGMNKSSYCLVEEFVASKTVIADNIPYDPTMRVIFVLCYDNNIPRIDILGAYWKTPPLALNEKGHFIEKHKSHAAKQMHTAIPVDPEDYQKVTEIMHEFMPKIYAKMLHI
jgi:hypothetical protein